MLKELLSDCEREDILAVFVALPLLFVSLIVIVEVLR